MKRPGLLNRVKQKMDEYTPNIGVDHPFDAYIDGQLDESADELLKIVPLYLLEYSTLPITRAVYANDSVYVPLPSDWKRLAQAKYPAWEKEINQEISIDNPDYPLFQNVYLRGGISEPTAVIVQENINNQGHKRYIRFHKVEYTSGTAKPKGELYYIKDLKPEELPERLVESLTWLTASRVYLIMGLDKEAKYMEVLYKNSFKGLQK